MKHTKKTGWRMLAALLAVCMFCLCACAESKPEKAEELKPVTVEREPEPQALQTANESTVIALRQYIYARLLTEAFLSMEASSMTMEELSKTADELLLAWENAELYSSIAADITNRAVRLLESPGVKQASSAGQPQARFMTLAAVHMNLQTVALAAGGPRTLDPQTWAENLTRQYDALRGANRYQQLAQQLGTDARTAYKQMALAQKVIRNAAELEEAEGVVNAWTQSINYLQGVKTASKVGLFVAGTVATGGGSLSALGAGSMTLGQAGATIVGGTDCIVDIAATGSNILLGENHQVTVGFNDVKDKLAPVSAVVGLATFNAAETGEQLAYIGDTLVDWFYEGKVMGVQLDGNRSVTARIFDSAGSTSLKSALETAGYVFPETAKTLIELMDEYKSDPVAALNRMDALVSQMAELELTAGGSLGPDSPEAAPPEDEGEQEPQSSTPPSAAPSQSAAPDNGTLTAQDISGTYDLTLSLKGWGEASCTAEITVSGDTATITDEWHDWTFNLSGNILTKYFEESEQLKTFVLTFRRENGTIVGSGVLTSKQDGSTGTYTYTKVQ